MGVFACIVMGLCLAIAVVSAFVSFAPQVFTENPKQAKQMRADFSITFFIAGIIGLLFLIASTLTIVPTKNRGVVTSFGHVDYEIDNGLHLTYPWQNVTNMDGTVQLEKFDGAKNDGDTGNAVLVTLGNNTKAHANSSIQWRLDPASLGGLYQNFKSVETIKDNLVNTNFFQAMNTELGKFDPLACVPQNPTPQNPTPRCEVPDQASLGSIGDLVQRDVQDAMAKSNVGGKVTIDRVIITNVVYNDKTQDALNGLLEEKGKTRKAEQEEITNRAQSAANDALKNSLSNDPNILANKCFDLIRDGKLNSAVGCWPGSVGAGVPVISVPSK